jgi:GT2 family glycosyltransferase
MIPVLIIPVLNRWDLAERLLASVDVPVDRIVIVDNGQLGIEHPGAEVIRPIANLGCGGGFNAGIIQTPDAPWWLWASNDMEFGPGDMAAIAQRVERATGPAMVTGDRRDERLLRNVYGAINRATVEAVGLFDEWTFYPAYFEDDDYEYRCRMGGVEWIEYNGQIRHQRSSTINSDPAIAAANARTFPLNRDRYVAKWGGAPGAETYPRPWNLPVPLSYTRVDLAGRAARTWSTDR